MRFSDDGPDVPNELIQLQRQGDVAFVVGAGISKRADLPLFEELTRLIYQAAMEPLPKEPLSLAGKGEIDAFQAKEWDRALGLLERRVSFRNPQLPDSLHLTRVRQEAENLLNYKPGSKLDAHSAILNISRDGHGRPRLITTNFDTLLERAAVQLRKEPPPSYAGQAMPPVGGPDFHGILHLHGRIEDREVDCGRTELILTSGDFGEAYLRAGWASRFIYDLMRRYTLVFVGYEANDPPMRYMLEAVEAARDRFPDLKERYAFAPLSDKSERDIKEIWDAKGCKAIAFDDEAKSFQKLYDTLGEWSSFSLNPRDWAGSRIKHIVRVPYLEADGGTRSDAKFLAFEVRLLQAVSDFAKDSTWIGALVDQQSLEAESMEALGVWLRSRLDDRILIEWILARENVTVRKKAARVASSFLRLRPKEIQEPYREFWFLFVAAQLSADKEQNEEHWYDFSDNLSPPECVRLRHIGVVVGLLSPKLCVDARIRWGERQSNDVSTVFDLCQVDFKCSTSPSYHEILDKWPRSLHGTEKLFAALQRALEESLSLADDVAENGGGRFSDHVKLVFEPTSEEMNQFDKDEHAKAGWRVIRPDTHDHTFAPIVRTLSELWRRIEAEENDVAERLALRWLESEQTLIVRLGFWAATDLNGKVFSCAEQFIAGLDASAFWVHIRHAEFARFYCKRWNDFKAATRQKLEAAMLRGPDANNVSWSEDKAIRRLVVEHRIHQELARVISQGGILSKKARKQMSRLSQRHPDLSGTVAPTEGRIGSTWSGSGGHGDVSALEGVGPSELLAVIEKLEVSHHASQSDLWEVLCYVDQPRALVALRAIFPVDQGPWQRWNRYLLSIAQPKNGSPSSADILMEVVGDVSVMSEVVFMKLRSTIRIWLEAVVESPDNVEAKSQEQREVDALKLWDRLLSAQRSGSGEVEESRSTSGDEAFDVWGGEWGNLAELLLKLQKSRDHRGAAEVSNDILERLNILLAQPSECRVGVISRLLTRLDYVMLKLPEFVEANLFSATREDSLIADQLVLAALGNYSGDVDVFPHFKTAILRAISAKRLGEESTGVLGRWIYNAAMCRLASPDYNDISDAEIKFALHHLNSQSLSQLAWKLWKLLKCNEANRLAVWQRQIRPFLENYWPIARLANELGNEDVMKSLVRICSAADEIFDVVVDFIVTIVAPYKASRFSIDSTSNEDGQIVDRFPEATLKLLSSTILRTGSPPYGLAEILAAIVDARPALADDPRWQALNEYCGS